MPQHVLTKFMRVRAGAAPGGVRQSEGRKVWEGLGGFGRVWEGLGLGAFGSVSDGLEAGSEGSG